MVRGEREVRLIGSLAAIHQRTRWMADGTARAAWVGRQDGRNDLMAQKEKLVEEVEHLLNQIERIGPGV